jgi:hypothetical protein
MSLSSRKRRRDRRRLGLPQPALANSWVYNGTPVVRFVPLAEWVSDGPPTGDVPQHSLEPHDVAPYEGPDGDT